jgi:hypothetical protein
MGGGGGGGDGRVQNRENEKRKWKSERYFLWRKLIMA